MVEPEAVNFVVLGSSPRGGATLQMGYYTTKDVERTVNALSSGWVGALPTYPTIFDYI